MFTSDTLHCAEERQQLCSIALIPQLDFDQKAKWIQDPALPNLLHEIAGIDQVVSAAHRSPRSPGCKAKPVCSGLWLVLVELVALLNCRLDESNDVTSPYAVWPHLPLKESEKVLYSALWTALDHSTDPSALLTHLTAVIHVLNGLVEPVSNLFQLEDVHNQTWRTGYALLSSRALLFRSLKWSIIQSELKLMTDGEPNADPPVTLDLNRFLTATFNPSQNGSTLGTRRTHQPNSVSNNHARRRELYLLAGLCAAEERRSTQALQSLQVVARQVQERRGH